MRPSIITSFRRISFKRGNTLEEAKLAAAEAAEEHKVIPKAPIYKVLVTEESLKKEISISNLDDRDIVLQILQKPAQRRQEIELRFMKSAFREIRFFAEREADLTEKYLKEMYRKLKLEQFETCERVFKTGDTGSKFYIILKGSVYVLLDKEGIQEDVGLRKSRTINFDERKRHLEEMQVHLKKFIQENPECPEEVLRSKFEKANPDLWIARSMHPGDSFGEIALFDQGDGKRTATIVCREDTLFGILNRDDFQSILSKLYERKKIDLVNFFRKIDIFADWSYSDVMSLLPHFEQQTYQRNYVLYRQNEPPHYLYFIFRGQIELKKIEVLKKNEDPNQNNTIESLLNDRPKNKKLKPGQVKQEIRIGLINEGEYFGEVEVTNDQPRKYTAVVASQDAHFLLITKEKFHRLVRDKKSLTALNTHIDSKEKWHSRMTQNYENIHHTPDNENLTPRNYAKAKENMNDVTKQLYYGTEANFFKAFQGLSMPPPRVSTAMQERVEPVKLITFTEKIFSPKLKALGNTKLKAPMTLKLTNLQKRLDDVDKALGLPSSARNPDSQRMLSKEEIDQEERNAETIFNFIVQPKKPIKKQNIITTSLKVIRTETSSVSPDKLFYPMSRLETPTNQGLESLRESKPKMKMRNLRQLKTKLDRILLDGIKTEESALMTHGEHRKHFSLSKNSTTKSTKNSINDSQKPIQISKWSYFTKN